MLGFCTTGDPNGDWVEMATVVLRGEAPAWEQRLRQSLHASAFMMSITDKSKKGGGRTEAETEGTK